MCPLCARQMAKREDFLFHVRTVHAVGPPIVCPHCSKAGFTSRNAFYRHKRTCRDGGTPTPAKTRTKAKTKTKSKAARNTDRTGDVNGAQVMKIEEQPTNETPSPESSQSREMEPLRQLPLLHSLHPENLNLNMSFETKAPSVWPVGSPVRAAVDHDASASADDSSFDVEVSHACTLNGDASLTPH